MLAKALPNEKVATAEEILGDCDTNKDAKLSMKEAMKCARKHQVPKDQVKKIRKAWPGVPKTLDHDKLEKYFKKLYKKLEKKVSGKDILEECDMDKDGLLDKMEANKCM
jgi:hypothetical protein